MQLSRTSFCFIRTLVYLVEIPQKLRVFECSNQGDVCDKALLNFRKRLADAVVLASVHEDRQRKGEVLHQLRRLFRMHLRQEHLQDA